MTPHTCSSLEGVLKDVWTRETMDSLLDTQRAMNRQLWQGGGTMRRPPVRFSGSEAIPDNQMYVMPINVDMRPEAVRARKQRVLEMNNRLAAVKRGNKPSYRQRQKNAKAARNG